MIFRWARHPGSAPIARDRLKVLLTHERTLNSRPDLLSGGAAVAELRRPRFLKSRLG